ncbi:M23 family metallopeptidase [Streptomyces sp. JJ36]|uniref:M23 family metallopeptidase n=1 Tax=Streptomyces sp. JJ36 TaxID=2736645 RepID=UPI001F31B188|nr:M23 family metallopeptidase [Streptomyces sp. JJ36]MCF6522774.1 M23 family metallopeptidase [Streptomyces sp. JJ36]
MALTRATGRHRRPARTRRVRTHLTGAAGLATAGVVGTLAAPAVAVPRAAVPAEPAAVSAESAAEQRTGLATALSVRTELAEALGAQAETQRTAAAEAETRRRAAAARAERRERAARAAERRAALRRHVAPVAGSYVSTPYGAGGGMWSSGTHTGVDFHAAAGTRVRAVAAGEVVEAGWSGAYGLNVVIRHRDGRYTQYGHLSSLAVAAGRTVAPGEGIGRAGSTGNSTGPHLHFEVRTAPGYGSDVDPLSYLRRHGVRI